MSSPYLPDGTTQDDLDRAIEGPEDEELHDGAPEILDLRPLSRRPIMMEISRRGPAPFHLIDEETDDDIDF